MNSCRLVLPSDRGSSIGLHVFSQSKTRPLAGLINQELMSRHLTDLQGPIYSIAGPPAMVAGMRKMLVAANVDEDDIRTEDFAGY
jgi:ferredoxin-NADP reductase